MTKIVFLGNLNVDCPDAAALMPVRPASNGGVGAYNFIIGVGLDIFRRQPLPIFEIDSILLGQLYYGLQIVGSTSSWLKLAKFLVKPMKIQGILPPRAPGGAKRRPGPLRGPIPWIFIGFTRQLASLSQLLVEPTIWRP